MQVGEDAVDEGRAGRQREQLVEWVRPVADELGAADFLAIPERNSAERQIARQEEGASLREIFMDLIQTGRAEESRR